MKTTFSVLFFSIIILWIKLIESRPPDIHDISAVKGIKLILNDSDVPEKYRNFIFFDENGQHFRGSNEIMYRIFVPDPYELKFFIRFFPDHSHPYDCGPDGDKRWWESRQRKLNRKLFHMILQNYELPLDITELNAILTFTPFNWNRKYGPRLGSNQLNGTYEVSWKANHMSFNDLSNSREQDIVELPEFSNINDTNIYYFDLFYNEIGNLRCNYEVVLSKGYYVGIILYESNVSIYENYSSYFLALLLFFIILILLSLVICGGAIYLGFLTGKCCFKESKKTLESNQPESSYGFNKCKGEKIESKSDSNEISDEHLLECDCIECNEDQRDKEKLFRSMIPDIQKIISNCINDGIDQKYLVPQSQTAFTKLIKKEMKRRNLKPKKNEIEEVVKKLVTDENVKAAIEQRKTSTNLVIKIEDDLKV